MRGHKTCSPDTFLYFSYCSNMLSFVFHMNNPSADFISIARLDASILLDYIPITPIIVQNYRLDFVRYSKFWGGPTATLVATANAHVWGAIWRLGIGLVDLLDEQEGVNNGTYYPKHMEVLTPYMGTFQCRVYMQKLNLLPRGDNDVIPVERWPSWTYKEVLILGAMEHELPPYYIQDLEKYKNNGEKGCLKMYTLLLKYVKEGPCTCDGPKKRERLPYWISETLKKKIEESKNTKK